MHTIAITNLKGGVGKTTTAVHLAVALGAAGHRTLLLDADGQGHCAVFLGLERSGALSAMLLSTKQGEEGDRAYRPTADFITRDVRPGVDLISCDPTITAAEARISGETMRELRLARRLSEVAGSYDYAVIDVGPKTDLLSTLALLAADSALIVTTPNTPDESLMDVTARLSALTEDAGRGPRIIGVLATQVDPREGLAGELRTKLAEAGFDDAPVIGRAVAFSKARVVGKTIFETEPRSPGALAYADLAAWAVQKAGAHVQQ